LEGKQTPYSSRYYARLLFPLLSTFGHADSQIMTTRSGREVNMPNIVETYNKSMGGVDVADQMINTYNDERKSLK